MKKHVIILIIILTVLMISTYLILSNDNSKDFLKSFKTVLESDFNTRDVVGRRTSVRPLYLFVIYLITTIFASLMGISCDDGICVRNLLGGAFDIDQALCVEPRFRRPIRG